ncbi:hypothetical protein MKY31_17490 [Bacillus sp. FSL M8-0139]|uniref:hypothetical protein n=1 Tax=Bacillus sp. FSL M8-0139 TaxID=2921613 RepID=UPI0030F69577
MDRELEKKSKGNVNGMVLPQNLIEEQFKAVTKDYIDSINQMYDGETQIDLKHVYKNIGNLEMLNNLLEDEYLKDLLASGYKILRGYEEKIR